MATLHTLHDVYAGDPDWPPRHPLGYEGLDDVHDMPVPPIVPKGGPRIPRQLDLSAGPIVRAFVIAVCAVLSAIVIVSAATEAVMR
jgi:hypothetical protein